jgi:HAD superfamily hydrolase (TIGR01509 family)
MPSFPTVVFDLGKVLVDFDYSIAARRIAARCGIPLDQIRVFLQSSPLLVNYETGRVSTAQFFDEIRRITGFSGTQTEFGEFFADIFTEMPSMIELHAALRKRGVPAFIFSNTNDLAVSHIRRRFPFFSDFDGYILSYEHGVMKPDTGLYEVVERETGRRAGEIVYIDDRPENVAAGAARGWRTVLQETPEKTRAALTAFGLPVGAAR